jgi:hypothetical protein
MISCQLTVVYPSILQQKLVFLLPHGTSTDSFSVGVVTRDKVNWLPADLTAFNVCQHNSMLSPAINRTSILHHSPLPVT